MVSERSTLAPLKILNHKLYSHCIQRRDYEMEIIVSKEGAFIAITVTIITIRMFRNKQKKTWNKRKIRNIKLRLHCIDYNALCVVETPISTFDKRGTHIHTPLPPYYSGVIRLLFFFFIHLLCKIQMFEKSIYTSFQAAKTVHYFLIYFFFPVVSFIIREYGWCIWSIRGTQFPFRCYTEHHFGRCIITFSGHILFY